MITFFSLISGLFMSIIYCLLHMGMRLGQRGILNRRAGRRRPRVLEFGVKKKVQSQSFQSTFTLVDRHRHGDGPPIMISFHFRSVFDLSHDLKVVSYVI